MFEPQRGKGPYGELYLRRDIANILSALEITNPRAAFEQGWMEALRRVAIAVAVEHKPAAVQPPCILIDLPTRSTP